MKRASAVVFVGGHVIPHGWRSRNSPWWDAAVFADSVEALEIDYGFDEWTVANELGEDYESSHELILIE
ncbi:hypothetical protein MCEMAEM6B_00265 [Mycobacteriaceae bacterium]